jgi:hypothetical protein
MRRGSTLLLSFLLATGSCGGGSSGSGKGGASGRPGGGFGGGVAGGAGSSGQAGSGAAAGQRGGGAGATGASAGVGGSSATGGAPGVGGAAGIGGDGGAGAGVAGAGGGGRDGGTATDAGQDAATACAVAVDGGRVACTTRIVSGNDNDIYCALKADGRINCWAADGLGFLFMTGYGWSDALATAPPNLVQLSMTNAFTESGGPIPYLLCGVDNGGKGICWGGGPPVTIGQGLEAVVLSQFGTCTLDATGAVSCGQQIRSVPPSSQVWARILPSEQLVAALDVNGAPYYPYDTFPDGTYLDIAANDAQRVGAIRSDGTAVTIIPGTTVEKSGTFTHIALDYSGRACAIDASGEVTCWAAEANVSMPAFTPPPGPFVQIAGAESTFCAVRTTGTTVCFGDHAVSVPAGW